MLCDDFGRFFPSTFYLNRHKLQVHVQYRNTHPDLFSESVRQADVGQCHDFEPSMGDSPEAQRPNGNEDKESMDLECNVRNAKHNQQHKKLVKKDEFEEGDLTSDLFAFFERFDDKTTPLFPNVTEPTPPLKELPTEVKLLVELCKSDNYTTSQIKEQFLFSVKLEEIHSHCDIKSHFPDADTFHAYI